MLNAARMEILGVAMARTTGKRVGVWIILGLLFVGLVGFGGAGLQSSVRSLGTVGERDLPIVEYQNAIQQRARALSAQLGIPVTIQMLEESGIDQQVLSGLIDDKALDEEIARLGISVGDAAVREAVLNDSSFAGLTGDFDRSVYRELLDRNGLTEEAFEQQIRDQRSRSLLQSGVFGGVEVSDALVDTILAFQAERRDITWATVDAQMVLEEPAAPTNADLQAFFEANPESFTSPATREITYAWLSPDMISAEVVIDEAALQELYEERLDQFVQPERRLVERMPLPEAEAAAAIVRILSGEIDFDGLAAERDVDIGLLDMGDVTEAQLGGAGDAVFSAEAGEVVGPLPSPLGPALFRVNAILDAQNTSFDEALPELRAELANARARRIIDEEAEGLADLMAGGARLEDLVERSAMQLGQISWTDASEDGIAAYSAFRDAAAAAEIGDYPQLVTLEDGGIFALRLEEVRPPAVREFASVIEDVAAQWQAQELKIAIEERAQQLVGSLRAGSAFEDLGLVPEVEENLTRRSFVPAMPVGFVSNIFEMQEGDIQVFDNGESVVIAQLDATRDPNIEDADVAALRGAIREQISQAVAQDLYLAFQSQIRSATDVSIDLNLVAQVNAAFQ